MATDCAVHRCFVPNLAQKTVSVRFHHISMICHALLFWKRFAHGEWEKGTKCKKRRQELSLLQSLTVPPKDLFTSPTVVACFATCGTTLHRNDVPKMFRAHHLMGIIIVFELHFSLSDVSGTSFDGHNTFIRMTFISVRTESFIDL